MTTSNIRPNKTVLTMITAAFLSILISGCADKGPSSSYDNNSAKWQQQKAKEAVKNIDE